jgi:hypothetical protein
VLDAIKKAITAIAPILGSAIGGPATGAAISILAKNLLGKEDATEEDILSVLSSATPEQIAIIKKSEYDFYLTERSLINQDLESARRMNVDLANSAVPSNVTKNLAYITIFGFFLLLFILFLLVAFNIKLDSTESGLIGGAIGYASAKSDQIVSFYFGSSIGSRIKDTYNYKK